LEDNTVFSSIYILKYYSLAECFHLSNSRTKLRGLDF
jgi:hypothetical protein